MERTDEDEVAEEEEVEMRGGRRGKKIEAGEVSRDRGERKRDGERREKRKRERGGKIVWAEQTGIEKEELIKIQIL